MKKIFTLLFALLGLATTSVNAQDFFDTSKPDDLMNLGVRLGVNTSNRTIAKDVFNVWNNNSWGTGVNIGVVADINFRNWISLQPGFFFESRSGKYSYVNINGYAEDHTPYYRTQFGKDRSYNFMIPILASVHFNLSQDVRWNVEFGPYFQIFLKNSVNGNFSVPSYYNLPEEGLRVLYTPIISAKSDFGFKMGTTLDILKHYNVGIHYEAGALHPWKDSKLGGHRKAWVFSLGYNF